MLTKYNVQDLYNRFLERVSDDIRKDLFGRKILDDGSLVGRYYKLTSEEEGIVTLWERKNRIWIYLSSFSVGVEDNLVKSKEGNR